MELSIGIQSLAYLLETWDIEEKITAMPTGFRYRRTSGFNYGNSSGNYGNGNDKGPSTWLTLLLAFLALAGMMSIGFLF